VVVVVVVWTLAGLVSAGSLAVDYMYNTCTRCDMTRSKMVLGAE